VVLLNSIDNMVILGFIVLLLGIGYYFSTAVKDMESFYLANRSLPWSLVVGALVATWYGGVGTVGTVEYAAMYGLSVWAIWCVTAHAGRMPLALWVGPRIHLRTDITVPDLLESFYGKGVAILASVLMIVYCTQLGEITATGFISHAAWGISKEMGGTVMVALCIALSILGGLMGITVTDMILFWCMVFGLCMVLPGQWDAVGGWAGLHTALAKTPELLDPLGGLTPMKALMLCVVAFGVYADPAFYQRFSASESPKTGRRALLTSFIIWLCFDLVLTLTGLVVKAKYPDLQPAEGYIKLVLSNLPVGVRALFIIGIIGAIVSTLDGYYLTGGATLAYDLIGRVTGKKLTPKQAVNYSRVGILIMGAGSLLVAFRFPTAQDAFLFVASIWMAAGFVPLVGGLMIDTRRSLMGGYLSMIVGAAIFSWFKIYPIQAFELDPLIAALPCSAIAWLVGNRFGPDTRVKEAA
jgi:SSS family solute:Na+ symporter